jgi:hypothetical protein
MAETLKSLPRGKGKSNYVRAHLYRAVHAAIRANGMDDDDRKALQQQLFGKASLSDMSDAEISMLLNRLNKDRNNKAPAGHRAHVGKIRALWWSLYWLGEVESSDERAISAFVKRQTNVSALRFVDHRTAPAIIEGLKSWLARVGVEWPSGDLHAITAARHPGYSPAHADRIAVLRALGARLGEVGIPADIDLGELGQPCAMSIEQLDGLIRERGERVRAGRK